MERFVCIHGHFYQPPRENPWLEAIELQDSAYPYHDWNERITAECYGPNAAARILDGENRIVAIVNNYASISFNFGPTLLSWIETARPDVYAAILEADRLSAARFSGHGSALAQAYNHMILPLANAATRPRRSSGGSATSSTASGGAPKGCGCRRRPSTRRRSRSSPRRASSSRSSRRTRPTARPGGGGGGLDGARADRRSTRRRPTA